MRRLLNRLLARFGYLLVKAPAAVRGDGRHEAGSLPGELGEPVAIRAQEAKPAGPLFEIFSSEGDVHKWYHYFEIYERHFAPYRDRPITVLEIGVFRGGSLRMWRRYFHPGSTIVGVDIDPSCAAQEAAEQNIFVRIGNQVDPAFLASVTDEFGPFDIILDDGSHRTHHQSVSFAALFRPALKDGGCYMVEDCHGNYWTKHVDSPETFIELAKRTVDVMHEPYFGRRESNFRKGHADALNDAEVSYLSANLGGVHFYDSIVVFDKRSRGLPVNELRERPQLR